MSNKKSFNQGTALGLKLSEDIIKHDTQALEYLAKKVDELPTELSDIKTLIHHLAQDYNDSEVNKLYGITKQFNLTEMDEDDRILLLCIIATIASEFTPNENQQAYFRAIRKYLEVNSNNCIPLKNGFEKGLAENIDSIKTQKLMYLVIKEYLFLAHETNNYGELYDIVFQCFIRDIKLDWVNNFIDIKVKLFGVLGLIDQYYSYSDEQEEDEDITDSHISKIEEILTGDYDEASKENAIKELSKYADMNNLVAMCLLADCYLKGVGVQQDFVQAVRLFEKAAEGGYAPAQFELGKRYALGEGVELDFDKAVEYYMMSAEHGYYKAQNNLGTCYFCGNGVITDKAKAFSLYQESAKNTDSVIAPFNIAMMYIDGDAIPQDINKGLEWLEVAISRNNVNAMYQLAELYYDGKVVESDYTKAFELYTLASQKGDIESVSKLGLCYYLGRGTKINEIRAAELFEKASSQYDVLGMQMYVYCLSNGIGIKKDTKKANLVRKEAKNRGINIDIPLRYRIASRLSDFANKAERASFDSVIHDLDRALNDVNKEHKS